MPRAEASAWVSNEGPLDLMETVGGLDFLLLLGSATGVEDSEEERVDMEDVLLGKKVLVPGPAGETLPAGWAGRGTWE